MVSKFKCQTNVKDTTWSISLNERKGFLILTQVKKFNGSIRTNVVLISHLDHLVNFHRGMKVLA